MDPFELLIYHTAQENASIEVVLRDETIWATQKAMVEREFLAARARLFLSSLSSHDWQSRTLCQGKGFSAATLCRLLRVPYTPQKNMKDMTVNGIKIEVERKAIKNIHLAVYPPDGRVHVSSPNYASRTICFSSSDKP